MPELTTMQHKSIKSILNMIESGEPEGVYDQLVVLVDENGVQDGAGITFGKMQTTENGGGLYDLLNRYINLKGKYANNFRPFMGQLYYSGGPKERKDALTENAVFRDTLVMAARNDILMRKAQDDLFDEKYYKPALIVSDQYSLVKPLSIAVVFDSTIHSGEGDYLEGFDPNVVDDGNEGPDRGVGFHFWKFSENYDGPESEEAFIAGYLEYRWKFLAGFKRVGTRRTVYRLQLFKNLIAAGKWNLDAPFDLWWDLKVEGKHLQRKRTVTSELLEKLP